MNSARYVEPDARLAGEAWAHGRVSASARRRSTSADRQEDARRKDYDGGGQLPDAQEFEADAVSVAVHQASRNELLTRKGRHPPGKWDFNALR